MLLIQKAVEIQSSFADGDFAGLLCVCLSVCLSIYAGIAVGFGSNYGTLVTGTVVVILMKSSEVLSMPEATPKEKLVFLGLTFGAQFGAFWAFMSVILGAEKGLA
eukprot:SAG22_NODE_85_length_21510_cov_6.472187_4_plen_105_part_00